VKNSIKVEKITILANEVYVSISSKKQLVNNPKPSTDEEIENFVMKKGMYCMCEMTIVKVLENQIISESCISMLPDNIEWLD